MTDYGPSIQACKLWQKTSAKGVVYFTGRLGGLKVTILPNRAMTSDTDATHVMLLGEALPYQPPASRTDTAAPQAEHVPEQAPPDARWDPPTRPAAPKQGTSRNGQKPAPRGGPKQQMEDSDMPF